MNENEQRKCDAWDGELERDAARWRMLPAFFEEFQIDGLRLLREIDEELAERAKERS